MRALIFTIFAACVPCRQNGASAADEPGLIAVYCVSGASDCVCVDE